MNSDHAPYPQYSKGVYNSRLGLAVMRQMSADVNAQLIVSIMLPEPEAQKVADAFIAALNTGESQ